MPEKVKEYPYRASFHLTKDVYLMCQFKDEHVGKHHAELKVDF